jgi:hypothetical protein
MGDLCTREDDGRVAVALRGKPGTAAAADVAGSAPQIIVDPPALQFTDASSRWDDRSHGKARVSREPAGRRGSSGSRLARGADVAAWALLIARNHQLPPSRTAAATS